MHIVRMLVLLLFFTFVGCSSMSTREDYVSLSKQCEGIPNARLIELDNTAKTVKFRLCGEMGPKTPKLLSAELDKVDKGKTIKMEIISPGGLGVIVNDLADILNSHHVHVIFPGLCASSCVKLSTRLESVTILKTAVFVEHFTGVDIYLYVHQALQNEAHQGLDMSDFEFLTKVYGPNTPYGKNEEKKFSAERVSALNVKCVGFLYQNKLYIYYMGNQLIVKDYDNWILTKPYLQERIKAKKLRGLSTYKPIKRKAMIEKTTGDFAHNRILSDAKLPKINPSEYRLCTKQDMESQSHQ